MEDKNTDLAIYHSINLAMEGQMKIGIIIYSNDPETVWNAFRYANFAIKEGNEVKVFLTGKGVKAESH